MLLFWSCEGAVCLCSHFISFCEGAVVAVDSSHLTTSSSASWLSCSPPSNFVNWHASTIWLIVCCYVRDLARPHLWRIARHGPWPSRKWLSRNYDWRGRFETMLLYSRVSYNGVVDHRSRLPVLSPLHSCIDRCRVWPNWALGGTVSRGGGWLNTSA